MSLCCHGNLCFGTVIENVIKYDLYIKFPQIFAHNVQIRAKFSCKNFTDVCPVFWILRHYTWEGAFFRVHAAYANCAIRQQTDTAYLRHCACRVCCLVNSVKTQRCCLWRVIRVWFISTAVYGRYDSFERQFTQCHVVDEEDITRLHGPAGQARGQQHYASNRAGPSRSAFV